MRMRGYRIYTIEDEAQGRVYSMTPNLNNQLVPECGGVSVSYCFIRNCPMKFIRLNGGHENAAVPSVDFECTVAICIKSRSITIVVLNNSFIP